MKRLQIVLFQIIIAALILSLGCPQGVPVLAQGPTDWQGSATGLSVEQNEDRKTAGLGFVVQAENWPFLSLRGGVEDSGTYYGDYLEGPIGIELGQVKLPENGSASLASESVDWAHNEMTFTSDAASQLKLWVSRLSPAILVQSSSDTLRLLAGNVTGNLFDGSRVTPRPEGPGYPKYVAYTSGGNPQIETLGTSATPLPSLDQNWLLLWYGDNSHFVETKKPLTYGDATIPHTEAYQADAPLLLVFQNQPTAIKHSDEGGVEVSFASASGYISLLPLLGRDHPTVAETESWAQGLPDAVLQKAQWWAEHQCAYPVGVSETYAYDAGSDSATITESVNFLGVCSGGTTFALLPPMLSLAKEGLNVSFSGSVTDGNLNTEFGPSLGIENVQAYTWRVAGFKRYTDARRLVLNTGQAPNELEQELLSEVEEIINAGHFAPWIFLDHIPSHHLTGHLYWANPADVLYHLTEIAEVLPDDLKIQFVEYIQAERSAYPPEDVYNLPLDEGTVRKDFSLDGQTVFFGQTLYDRWLNHRPDVFLKDVPLYSLFALARYYDLTGETLPSDVWQKAVETLNRDMSEQDWATFYWFKGFEDNRIAVISANRHFAGLIGFIKLAKMAGDTEAENLGRALLAKAAVVRLGMAKYPRYLYSADLVELPPEPDWQPRYTAGRWDGWLFNYNWTEPYDDARQVATLDQFKVFLYDYSGFGSWAEKRAVSFTAYRDMVPELARFLTDSAKKDVEIYIDKVEAYFPHWYAAFAEGILRTEHNLSRPIDSFQSFMAKALIQQEDPQKLAAYVDIPWVHEGDLFYVHKLAETIRAYRGTAWDDTVSLSGAPGDRTIYLTWSTYTTLPPETTWQIDYQSQTGTLYTPITGIISPTRAYTLTGLTNYTLYSVTLAAMSGSTPLLSSNAVVVMPTDIFLYLPLVLRAW